jgi:hypothetical protein
MIPGLALKATAAGLVLALAAAGAQTRRLSSAHAELSQMARAHAEREQRREIAARQATEDARNEESRRAQAIAEVVHQQAQRAAQAEADAAGASAAADRLRERARALAARSGGASGNPAAAGQCEADRLADAIGRMGKAASELAARGDRAIIAGQACEQAYGALRP